MILFPGNTPLESRVSVLSGDPFDFTDGDQELLGILSPTIGGVVYALPRPRLTSTERETTRMVFRNERKLYRRTCDATGKSIISVYHPESQRRVYAQDYYASDAWNPLDFNHIFDPMSSPVNQFGDLLQRVPVPALSQVQVENCDYTQYSEQSRDCYMSASISVCESAHYTHTSRKIRNSFDVLNCVGCDECYEIVECIDSLFSQYCFRVVRSSHMAYSISCTDCEHCSLCVGLEHKKYHYLNKEYSPEEYMERLQKGITSIDRLEFQKLVMANDIPKVMNPGSENVIGNFNNVAHNLVNCNECFFLEDSRHVSLSGRGSYCMDAYNVRGGSSHVYESLRVGGSNIYFSIECFESDNLYYCVGCFGSNYCLFCVGLRQVKYCIYNIEYPEEEYYQRVHEILESMQDRDEWGYFLSVNFSPFGYNETIAAEQYPHTHEEVRDLGYRWSTYESPAPQASKTIPGELLPTDILSIPDDVLNWAIVCEVSKRPFRITEQELTFYRKYSIPLPRRHPDIRHLDRIGVRESCELVF